VKTKGQRAFWQGRQAEFAVQDYWIQQGYDIWYHRFQKFGAEIDLIVRKEQKILVFCEVKQRKRLSWAQNALSSSQKNRLQLHAEIFLLHHCGLWEEIRFDVIALDQQFRINHMINVL
jgi:Holliday junction resolvase-like predicted endonuclease